MRILLTAFAVLPLAGCLHDEVRIEAGPGTDAKAGHCAVGSNLHPGAPAETRSGPLPYDVPATWWTRDPDGLLLAGHVRALSPLPWWQRFPCDLALDLWPGDVRVLATAAVVPLPIRERTSAEITAEARANGYAP